MSKKTVAESSLCPHAPHPTASNASVTHVVVGDRIGKQVNDPRLLTVAEARCMLAERQLESEVALHIGQGVDYRDISDLYQSLDGDGAQTGASMVPHRLPNKASLRSTHKQRDVNVLISQPFLKGDGSYSAQLLIDDSCADMSDHLTGEHVPGMAIAEAARQMIIAVTEEFFIIKGQSQSLRFVTHQMDIEYLEFLLPLAIEMRYVPVTLRRAGGKNMKLTCEVQFIQAAHKAALARFAYSVVERSYLESRESDRLDRLLNALCG